MTTSAKTIQAGSVRTVAANGHQLAVTGPTGEPDRANVVFVHGITGDVEFWDHTLPDEVSSQTCWAAIGLPGHFPSAPPSGFHLKDVTPETFADCIADAIRDLFDGQPVHLVGWSTGGFASLAVAARHPELVSSVTSISGFARGIWGNRLGMMQRIAQLGLPGRVTFRVAMRLLAGNPWVFRYIFAGLGASGTGRNKSFRSSLPAVRKRFSRLNFGQIALLFAGLRSIDTSSLVQSVRAPTLVIGGTDDTVIPIEETRHVASLLDNHELMEVSNCGHLFYCEAAEKIWPRVMEWIQRHNV